MNIKKVSQYSLLILLFILSYLFYNKYFTEDLKRIEKKEIENTLEKKKAEINQSDIEKNIIENLKYVSEDLLGNIYIINAKSAEIQEDKINQVQLEEVIAKIIQQNDETIYINSNFADYDRNNNNTIFKKNVSVQYGDQTINANIINLNFSKNLIEIQENVYYKNKNANIKADKIEINFESKKLKISMDKQDDKVKISGKY